MARTKRRIDQVLLMTLCRCKLQIAKFRHHEVGRDQHKKIFIHIGTHKTGSTSIQYFLRRQEYALKRCGILVPRSGTLSRTTGHHNIPWDLRRDSSFEDYSGGVDDLIIELKAASESIAVISSEVFEYLVQIPDILRKFHLRLIDIGYDPIYIVFFRNPSDYMRSLHSEMKKHNVNQPLEWYEAEIKAKGSVTLHGDWHHEFNYDRFVARWKAAVGEAILAFDYDKVSKSPGLLPFFFETVGASPEIVAASAELPPLNTRKAALRD